MRYHSRMPEPAPGRDAHAPHGVALHEAKLALRRQILARRDALSLEERAAASAAIASRIPALPKFVAAGTVLLTLAFRSEWNTRPLVAAALDAAKRMQADAESR